MIRFHLHRFGAEGGRTVLCLHGFLGSGADFEGTAAALGEGVRLLAPDLPGHGATVAGRAADYTMPGCATALLDLVAAETDAPPDLVGYSMGGRLALHLAVAARARFGRVAIVSATPGLPEEAERRARRAADRALARRITAGPLPEVLDAWYAQPLFATLDPGAPEVRAMHARRQAQSPAGLARSLRGMGTGAMAPLWDRLADAAPFDAIAGERDAKFAAIAARMAGTAGIRRHLIAGAGHVPHLEQPARFVQTLRNVLGMDPAATSPGGRR